MTIEEIEAELLTCEDEDRIVELVDMAIYWLFAGVNFGVLFEANR